MLRNFCNNDKNIFCTEAVEFLTNAVKYFQDRYNFPDDFIKEKLMLAKIKLFTWEKLHELPEILNISVQIVLKAKRK